jgi:peptidoglycan hydrolase CwlO-like protein
MPYREDEDALRARVDDLEHEASDEHAENERLRAELAQAKEELATREPDWATAGHPDEH